MLQVDLFFGLSGPWGKASWLGRINSGGEPTSSPACSGVIVVKYLTALHQHAMRRHSGTGPIQSEGNYSVPLRRPAQHDATRTPGFMRVFVGDCSSCLHTCIYCCKLSRGDWVIRFLKWVDWIWNKLLIFRRPLTP